MLTYSSSATIEPSLLTRFKEFKENKLVYPKMEVLNYFLVAEKSFQNMRMDLINNNCTFEQVAETFIHNHKLAFLICHESNVHALVRLFFRTRFFFALNKINRDEQQFKTNDIDKSSRSVAMRDLVKNVM